MARFSGAGELDRRISVQRRDPAVPKDETGHKKAAWPEFCRTWAKVEETTAKDRLRSPGELPMRSAKITIRWRSDVTDDMRIVLDGLIWEIRGMAEVPGTGRHRQLEIFAEMTVVPGKV